MYIHYVHSLCTCHYVNTAMQGTSTTMEIDCFIDKIGILLYKYGIIIIIVIVVAVTVSHIPFVNVKLYEL